MTLSRTRPLLSSVAFEAELVVEGAPAARAVPTAPVIGECLQERVDLHGAWALKSDGIALTKRGQIAVYDYHVNDRFAPTLEIHNALDDLTGEVDDAALAAAATAVGERRIVRPDI